MYILFSLVMAVTPSLLLVRYYYRQDTRSPEPKTLIIKIFILGIIYTIPVFVLESVISRLNVFFAWSPFFYYFFEAFIVAGLSEEYIKLHIVRKYVYHHPQFDKIMDGIIYTVVASLGFACMENFLYVMQNSWHIALARGFTAVPMHAVCSGMMGYYIGKAKFAKTKKEEKLLINNGLWLAIVLHGLYNFILFISPVAGSVFSFFIIAFVFGIYIKLREKIALAIKEDEDT
jgi:protease PrsW